AHVLLMLNPVSGRRKALKIFETIVKPMFEIGCTPYTLKISESPSHTSEIVLSADLSQYTSIVTVSGDGLLHDALNGLVSRKDWPKYRDMPLGVIPAGSGNGLAKSLDCIWPEQATVSVIKAHARPLDVMSVTLGSGITKYCFLSATWGLMADIDIESERMRWAGPARFDLYGMLRLMKLRYYGGRLHYLPALEHDDSDSPQRDRARKMIGSLPSGNSSMINVFSERTNHGIDDAWGLPPPSFSSPLIRNSPKQKPSSLALNVQPALTLKPTLTGGIQLPIREGSLPPRWKTVEGPFVQVMALNAPWVGAHFLASPYARLSDGMIDLVYSTAVSKWQVIPYMTNPVGDDHMNKDGVVHVKVRAMILEPTGLRTTNTNPRSHQMIQSPDATTNGQAAKSTNRFGSVRSLVTSTSNANKKDSTLAPQVPVPSRARSRTYATYHKQMAARGSSLLVQGLGVKQPADIDGSAAAAAAAAATSNGIDMPRIPGQALFSQRSETELAQINQETSSARELSSPSATNGNSSTPAALSQLGTVSAAAN
ncbi:Sphingosine kinase 1, partial [Dipsacomyces acuminosporus]